MNTRPDNTFDQASRYGSRAWVARRIGKSRDWLKRNADKLEGEQFPKVDPLIGLYIKDDVDQWIDKRRRILASSSPTATQGANLDAL